MTSRPTVHFAADGGSWLSSAYPESGNSAGRISKSEMSLAVRLWEYAEAKHETTDTSRLKMAVEMSNEELDAGKETAEIDARKLSRFLEAHKACGTRTFRSLAADI